MRSRVFSFAAIVSLVLGCALVVAPVAKAQIRAGSERAARPESSVHPNDVVKTTLALNLCVDGSTLYPCPPNVLTDTVYIPSITLTYGQILDGVVDYTAQGAPLTSGTITIYRSSPPANARIAVCTLRIGLDTACPADSTIFDVGNYTLSATLTFPPNSIFADFDTSIGPCASTPTCDVAVSVAKDTSSIKLSTSANPAALGNAVTFTAQVQGGYTAIATGQAVFSLDGAAEPAVTLDATGTGTFTTSTLPLGFHTITASYAGALDFLPAADATLTEQIVPPMTATTISSSLNPSILGQNVTFTSSVMTAVPGLTPTGAVTFKDGVVPFATAVVTLKGTLNLAQSPPISSLSAGTHSITATYSGDAATSPSVSPVLVQQVDYPLSIPPPGYTITITPSPVTLGTGQTAHLTVKVTPVSGFLGAVTLSCGNLPNESACTFGEATIPGGGGSTTLALSTMAPHDCGVSVPYGGLGAALHSPPGWSTLHGKYGRTLALAGALLLLLPRRRFKERMKSLLALLVLCGFVGFSGCGGRCTDFGTYPGSYTFKVDGAAVSGAPGTPPGGIATPNVSTSVALKIIL